jgi:hypothetical protein
LVGVWLALRRKTAPSTWGRPCRTAGLTIEREYMFYVILIVVAVILVGALYLMRGRRSA